MLEHRKSPGIEPPGGSEPVGIEPELPWTMGHEKGLIAVLL